MWGFPPVCWNWFAERLVCADRIFWNVGTEIHRGEPHGVGCVTELWLPSNVQADRSREPHPLVAAAATAPGAPPMALTVALGLCTQLSTVTVEEQCLVWANWPPPSLMSGGGRGPGVGCDCVVCRDFGKNRKAWAAACQGARAGGQARACLVGVGATCTVASGHACDLCPLSWLPHPGLEPQGPALSFRS